MVELGMVIVFECEGCHLLMTETDEKTEQCPHCGHIGYYKHKFKCFNGC